MPPTMTIDSLADFDIEVVSIGADLDVEKVSSFPSNCGEWQIVDSFPDFTVREVTIGGDFSVRYVNAFPGIP
jgi:hypothetical protein